MIAAAARQIVSAERFARVVTALAAQFAAGLVVGAEWPFMIAFNVQVVAWVPRAGHLALQVGVPAEGEGFEGAPWRTVTVAPGEFRAFEVIANHAGNVLVIGEARHAEAAFSIALEYLIAPLQAAQQHEHDPHAV